MKKIQFRTRIDYDYTKEIGEVNNEPSKTVPNEALTVREILQNYVKGVPLPIGKNAIYSNTDDFEDIDETRSPDFDLADASLQKRLLEQTISERKEGIKVKKQAEKAKKDADDKEVKEENERKLAYKEQKLPGFDKNA